MEYVPKRKDATNHPNVKKSGNHSTAPVGSIATDEIICHALKFNWTIPSHSPGKYCSPELVTTACKVKWKILVRPLRDNFVQIGIQAMDIYYALDGLFTFTIKRGEHVEFSGAFPFAVSLIDSSFFFDHLPIRDVTGYVSKAIEGKITFSGCCTDKKITKPKEINQDSVTQLQNDFGEPLKNKQFTDVVLKIGENEFPAHKFVLCARSPVFRDKFECCAEEKSESFVRISDCEPTVIDTEGCIEEKNVIQITDIETSVIEAFLIFLYTGILDDCDFNMMTKLYSTAVTYGVKSLQETCRNLLVTNCTENNVVKILKLAHTCNDDELKEKVILLICEKFSKIEPLEEWQSLLETNTRLASYVLRKVSANNKK